MSEQGPAETAIGRAVFEELLWVHAAVRRDLEVVRRLAVAVLDGLPPPELQATLHELETNGPLWQLRVTCLRYCRFVHAHHHLEDVLFFPALRRTDPAAASVIDRLEAEHRRVSADLDAVEAAAAALVERDDATARARVAGALDTLAANLIEHLDYEETSAGPTIRRLPQHPTAMLGM